ncbi:hypothetical protein AVEN_261763-1 [Araneus ventricosus]|uniref:Uncharacterized protein n=1 Tax=Araneus ventricosus TaxID=182803 RepID=A0A4Y2H124_ARAVE|nr:hypothetical protein AVEN_261763-1 [Araneus ventricosus]
MHLNTYGMVWVHCPHGRAGKGDILTMAINKYCTTVPYLDAIPSANKDRSPEKDLGINTDVFQSQWKNCIFYSPKMTPSEKKSDYT